MVITGPCDIIIADPGYMMITDPGYMMIKDPDYMMITDIDYMITNPDYMMITGPDSELCDTISASFVCIPYNLFVSGTPKEPVRQRTCWYWLTRK